MDLVGENGIEISRILACLCDVWEVSSEQAN